VSPLRSPERRDRSRLVDTDTDTERVHAHAQQDQWAQWDQPVRMDMMVCQDQWAQWDQWDHRELLEMMVTTVDMELLVLLESLV